MYVIQAESLRAHPNQTHRGKKKQHLRAVAPVEAVVHVRQVFVVRVDEVQPLLVGHRPHLAVDLQHHVRGGARKQRGPAEDNDWSNKLLTAPAHDGRRSANYGGNKAPM